MGQPKTLKSIPEWEGPTLQNAVLATTGKLFDQDSNSQAKSSAVLSSPDVQLKEDTADERRVDTAATKNQIGRLRINHKVGMVRMFDY